MPKTAVPIGSSRPQKDCRARPSTYSPSVNIVDGRLARPSLLTLPGTDGTIGRQGPAVLPGRLGTLLIPEAAMFSRNPKHIPSHSVFLRSAYNKMTIRTAKIRRRAF